MQGDSRSIVLYTVMTRQFVNKYKFKKNMVHPNELRIGNLIKMPFFGDVELKVTAISVRDAKSFIQTNRSLFFEKPESCEPIPLTKEGLLNFGFKINKNNYLATLKYEFLDSFKFLKVEHCGNGNYRVNGNLAYIKYIHQLQNLYFACTGKELTYSDVS